MSGVTCRSEDTCLLAKGTLGTMRRGFVVAMVMAVVAAGFVVMPGEAEAAGLDRKALQRKVTKSLATAYPGVPFGPVACRSLGERSRLITFTCTAAVGAAMLTVDGRQSGKRRQAVLEPREAVLAKATLETFVAENASLPATVDCGPDPWRVVAPSATLSCTAGLSDGGTRQVELTVADRAGTVSITKVT